jgi:serpin B
MKRPLWFLTGALPLLVLIALGCSKKSNDSVSPGTTDANGVYTQQQGAITLVKYNGPRDSTPMVPDSAIAALVKGNTAFATDLYHKITTSGSNILISPYSLSTALSMAWCGAHGGTESDMAATLHFAADQTTLPSACDALDLALASHAATGGFELHIVNQAWGEKTYAFLPGYLRVLSANYGAGMLLLDFVNSPDPSRQTINTWVASQTQACIQNLIPAGAIDNTTRLVLTNAIYFEAQWADTFQHEQTQDGTFYRGTGDSITTKIMHRNGACSYGAGSGYCAVRLPYKGNETSMLIILPDSGAMAQVESGLSADFIASVRSSLQSTPLAICLPKFTFGTGSIAMKTPLSSLGMGSAFSDTADFSGIDGTRLLRIGDVYHKAYVAVDERGTVAAAATAVIINTGVAEPPPTVFNANRPFIFLIQDDPTGAVLFLGKLADPSQQ